MDPVIHLDTHVVAWMYAGDHQRLAPVLPQLIRNRLVVSPMVGLELQYLYEAGRTSQPAGIVIKDLAERAGLRVAGTPFPRVVQAALGLSWTRDPFDRLIAAQALVESAPLLTQDSHLLAHCAAARWHVEE